MEGQGGSSGSGCDGGLINDINLDFCEDLFEHIDDFLDFPTQEIQGDSIHGLGLRTGGAAADDDSNVSHVTWHPDPTQQHFSFSNANPIRNNSTLSPQIPLTEEDIEELEWLSTFVDTSFSPAEENISLNEQVNKDNNHDNIHGLFQTTSPVSVLESSSSSWSGGGRTLPTNPETVIPSRARTKTKRPRPSPNPNYHLPRPVSSSPTSSITDSISAPHLLSFMSSSSSSSSLNFGESNPVLTGVVEQNKRNKKKILEQTRVVVVGPGIRKCLHCEITKTPQWRAGPLGPKTLCNACGVRYKSGRLFPEYRPAASPTFVPKLHSNSHKRVIEMRSGISRTETGLAFGFGHGVRH